MDDKSYHEILHGQFLAQKNTESMWGWGTPAGRVRARRRGELIANAAGLKPGMRVLEIGCGTGLFSEMFAGFDVHLTAIDISSELIEKAMQRNIKGKIEFIVGPFEKLELPETFDAIIGSSVLHHLNLSQALKNIHALLKPNGVMSFAEPNQLNPQVFFMFKFRSFFPEISPDENPFLRWKLHHLLRMNNFADIGIQPFDWLHPATPPFMIQKINRVGKLIERIPIISEFAGSILIRGVKLT